MGLPGRLDPSRPAVVRYSFPGGASQILLDETSVGRDFRTEGFHADSICLDEITYFDVRGFEIRISKDLMDKLPLNVTNPKWRDLDVNKFWCSREGGIFFKIKRDADVPLPPGQLRPSRF
jgi:hypothetical protein